MGEFVSEIPWYHLAKRRLDHHDAAVADEGGRRQGLGEGIDNHSCVRRGISLTKPALTSSRTKLWRMSMWRENCRRTGFWISDTGQIILIDFSCILLPITKIIGGFTKIASLLPGLAIGNEFGFGGRQRDAVLMSTLLRDRPAIHHKDVASVWAAGLPTMPR